MVRVTRIRGCPFAATAKAGTSPAQRSRSSNVITLNPITASDHRRTRQRSPPLLFWSVSRLKIHPVGSPPNSQHRAPRTPCPERHRKRRSAVPARAMTSYQVLREADSGADRRRLRPCSSGRTDERPADPATAVVTEEMGVSCSSCKTGRERGARGEHVRRALSREPGGPQVGLSVREFADARPLSRPTSAPCAESGRSAGVPDRQERRRIGRTAWSRRGEEAHMSARAPRICNRCRPAPRAPTSEGRKCFKRSPYTRSSSRSSAMCPHRHVATPSRSAVTWRRRCVRCAHSSAVYPAGVGRGLRPAQPCRNRSGPRMTSDGSGHMVPLPHRVHRETESAPLGTRFIARGHR